MSTVKVIYNGAHAEVDLLSEKLDAPIRGILRGEPVELPRWLALGDPGEPGVYLDEDDQPQTYVRADLCSGGALEFLDHERIQQYAIDPTLPLVTGEPDCDWVLVGKVPDAGVAEVVSWIGDDPERAREALAAEQAGKDRKGVIDAAEAVLAATEEQA